MKKAEIDDVDNDCMSTAYDYPQNYYLDARVTGNSHKQRRRFRQTMQFRIARLE